MKVFFRKGWAKHHIQRPGTEAVWCNSKVKVKPEEEVEKPPLVDDLCVNCARLSKWWRVEDFERIVTKRRRGFLREKEHAHLGTTLPRPGMNTPDPQ